MLNPSLNYLQNIVSKQEESNKKLEEELTSLKKEDGNFDAIAKRAGDDIDSLKQRLMPGAIGGVGGNGQLPEDFMFLQNNMRSEDLEVEERAAVSLAY